MDPNNVADDEARRIAHLEAVKGKVEADVHARIARESSTTSAAEQEQVQSVAAGLKHRVAAEVVETERSLQRARTLGRISQLANYCFFVLYGLIGLETVLHLVGARQGSGFKRFLDVITWPFLAPFKGLLTDPTVGSTRVMLSYLAAIGIYALVHLGVNRLLRVLAHRATALP